MKECCMTCRNRLDGIKSDFGKLGTNEEIDTPMEGCICLALAFEGVAYWLVNHDEESGICEMYAPRKPKHGKWWTSKAYPNIVFCDECGEPFERSNTEHFNFCPNCGADMRGGI